MNRIKLAAMVVILIGSWSGLSSAEVVLKIGYVDFQKIVDSWPEAKQNMENLEAQYEEVQKELNQRDQEIQEWNKDLEARKSLMSDEQKKLKEEEYQQKVKSYLETYNDKRARLEEKKQTVLDEVRNKVKAVVQDVAERNGYSFIMRKQDLVYASEKYDITDEVITDLAKKR